GNFLRAGGEGRGGGGPPRGPPFLPGYPNPKPSEPMNVPAHPGAAAAAAGGPGLGQGLEGLTSSPHWGEQGSGGEQGVEGWGFTPNPNPVTRGLPPAPADERQTGTSGRQVYPSTRPETAGAQKRHLVAG
ncbi:unnamed protein product, partial [Discosporangium mesarthrocarpum]